MQRRSSSSSRRCRRRQETSATGDDKAQQPTLRRNHPEWSIEIKTSVHFRDGAFPRRSKIGRFVLQKRVSSKHELAAIKKWYTPSIRYGIYQQFPRLSYPISSVEPAKLGDIPQRTMRPFKRASLRRIHPPRVNEASVLHDASTSPVICIIHT